MAVGMRPTQYSEALVKITKNAFEHKLRHRRKPTHDFYGVKRVVWLSTPLWCLSYIQQQNKRNFY
jgi:hypothetical protein